MGKFNHYKVTDPITGNTYKIQGNDNAANALIQFNTNAANQQLAKLQNDWNVQQWNRQNEYNSPANQVRLMMEAGLNPNSWTNAGSTAGAITSADMATAQAPVMQDEDNAALSRINDLLNTGLNAGSSAMDALYKRSQMEEMRANIAESKQRQRLFNSTFDDQVTLARHNANLVGAQYNSELQKAGKTFEETESIKQSRQIEKQLADDRHKLNKKTWDKLTQEIRGLTADADLKEFTTRFRKEFGVSPDADWLTNLIQLSLSDPRMFDNVVNRIGSNLGHIGKRLLGSFSWFNPD